MTSRRARRRRHVTTAEGAWSPGRGCRRRCRRPVVRRRADALARAPAVTSYIHTTRVYRGTSYTSKQTGNHRYADDNRNMAAGFPVPHLATAIILSNLNRFSIFSLQDSAVNLE